MSRLVYLARNKELHLLDLDLGAQEQLTYPFIQGKQIPSIWPVWSPDKRWIAYFQPPVQGEKAKVCVTEVGGLDMLVLAEMEDRLPIYIYWSPDSEKLAVIEQAETLELLVYSLDGSKPISLDDGAPIFFCWTPDSAGIVAHLIHPIERRSRVQYYSILDSDQDYIISEQSGGFCAPVFLKGQLIFAEKMGSLTQVLLYDLTTRLKTPLCAFNGVLALQPRPNHNQIAIATTSKGDGSPYMGVQLFDLETGKFEVLHSEPIQALFWTPDGTKLLMSSINMEHQWLEWSYWDGEKVHPICHFRPTREQVFFLHFFEQFSLSHQIISSEGDEFYFTGYEPPEERKEEFPQPMIFRASLEENGIIEPMMVGLFPSLEG